MDLRWDAFRKRDPLMFLPVFLLVLVGVLVVAGMLALPGLLAPSRRTPVKQMPYESGMDPVGDARGRFDVRFYLVAIVFLIFDVELLFLYPWAVAAWSGGGQATGTEGELLPAKLARDVNADWMFLEAVVFMGFLGLAYVYVWRKGVLDWR